MNLHQALQYLHDEGPIDWSFGICRNLQMLWERHRFDYPVKFLDPANPNEFFQAYEFVKYASIGWKHHTGDQDWPVPSFEDGQQNLWTGEALAYRKSLLQYLIKQVSQ